MRQIPFEVNNFTGGIVTDVSPLSYPDKASLDERNMLIDFDGARSRRFGIDGEVDFSALGYQSPGIDNLVSSSFSWKNVGGIPSKTFVVISLNKYFAIFDSSISPLSDGLIYEEVFLTASKVSFASVDGILIVATGSKDMFYYTYDKDTDSISKSSYRLLIRDLFGMEVVIDGINYREGGNIIKRPKVLNLNHMYNLRNQTFGMPRLGGGLLPDASGYNEVVVDCIKFFKDYLNSISNGTGAYPSNSDSVTDAMYANTESKIDPLTERFNPKELIVNPQGSLRAPIGFFIIDALDRGSSRKVQLDKLYDEKGALYKPYKTLNFNSDETPSGATVLAQFAGRMFYAGFSSEILDGDLHSPSLGSYVLFSKLVESKEDLKICYQIGDPTSKNYSEVLDTDGGFIKLDGAFNIVSMVPTSQGLCVLAENGVWVITGEDRGQFKATGYSTSKLSSQGCNCPNSVVPVNNGFWFWSTEGIFSVGTDKLGDLTVENKTLGVIQNLYNTISTSDKVLSNGFYDSYSRTLSWVFGDNESPTSKCFELLYYLDFSAFTLHEFGKSVNTLGPTVLTQIQVPPFKSEIVQEGVVVGVNQVQANLEDVYVFDSRRSDITREAKYVIKLPSSYYGSSSYTFAEYSDNRHRDWDRVLNPPEWHEEDWSVDAKAYILTGYLSGGDNQRIKQVFSVTTHFKKTEDGFEIDPDSFDDDWVPTNRSSCFLQAQWNWANNINSNKWGNAYQVYRHSRVHFPTNLYDDFDNGFSTVVTRNRLRGSGRVVSLLFSSEEDRHMTIYGWSMNVGVADSV